MPVPVGLVLVDGAARLRHPQELMAAAGISVGHIVQAARDLLGA